MNFQVPQFIDEKPKIIGFLTLPQFLYVAGAGLLSFFAFNVFNFFLWILITAVLGGLAVGLAFVKINGQPLPKVLFAALGYVWQPRQFTWQRAMKEASLDVSRLEKIEALRNSMSLQDKIKSLAMNVTTGKIFQGKAGGNGDPKEKYQVVTLLTGEKKMAKKVDY